MMLFQKVWIENPDLRQQLFNDELNVAHCEHCGLHARVASTMLVTNVPQNFAVWYEPKPDPSVDQFNANMERVYGQGNFYSEAPRVDSWEAFKETIQKFERGERVGKPLSRESLSLENIIAAMAARPE